jgi:hypothetical protein
MRKLIWTAVIVLPLIVAGGLVHGQSGPGEPAPVTIEESPCPLQCLAKHLQSEGSPCPLQRLLKHLGF